MPPGSLLALIFFYHYFFVKSKKRMRNGVGSSQGLAVWKNCSNEEIAFHIAAKIRFDHLKTFRCGRVIVEQPF